MFVYDPVEIEPRVRLAVLVIEMESAVSGRNHFTTAIISQLTQATVFLTTPSLPPTNTNTVQTDPKSVPL